MITSNDFARMWQDLSSDAAETFATFGRSGWYILGPEVKKFEEALAGYWGIPFAAGVASGLDAIEISLRALGCQPGCKVLTTPVSAFATTLAILKLGAVPVFADVDPHGLINLGKARAALQSDRAIRYFVPVHLYGHALDARELAAIRDNFDVSIVEDCAQSVGARSYGRPAGTVGQAAATSFYPTKNLGAMGDGGAILTGDENLLRTVRMLRDYGQSGKYQHDLIGYNSRLDELQAALLRTVFLSRLDGWLARRKEIAALYLRGIDNQRVNTMGSPSGSDSCWHLFPVLVAPDRKAAFLQHLTERQIQGGEHYPIAIPDQRAMATSAFELAPGGIERARTFCQSQVSLPIHPYLTDAEVTAVVDAVNNWAG